MTDYPPWLHDDFTVTAGDPAWAVVVMAFALGGAVFWLLLGEMRRAPDEG